MTATDRVVILALDRWGRALLVARGGTWAAPSGALAHAEPPDAGALRVFEELTGWVLEDLRLYAVRTDPAGSPDRQEREHIYYFDPDVPDPPPESGQRYFGPAEVPVADLPPETRQLLAAFFESSSYRAMFH